MKDENRFGFACRLAFAAWSAYCAWRLIDTLHLIAPGLAEPLAEIGGGGFSRADEFVPIRAVSVVVIFEFARWAAVAGTILASRWALGFVDVASWKIRRRIQREQRAAQRLARRASVTTPAASSGPPREPRPMLPSFEEMKSLVAFMGAVMLAVLAAMIVAQMFR